MSDMTIELLDAEKVQALWPKLEPMFEAACNAHEVAKDELQAKDIYVLAFTGLCAVFVGAVDGEPHCVLAIQFNQTNGRRGADILALAGKDLLRFKAAYWTLILDWLRANGVQFLDAYAPERLAKIYMNKFGFDKSCTYVRMTL